MQKDLRCYSFDFLNVCPDGLNVPGSGHNPRLFDILPSTHYKRKWEQLYAGLTLFSNKYPSCDTGIQIKHFLPSSNAQKKKSQEWYSFVNNGMIGKLLHKVKGGQIPDSPSQCQGFPDWKAYNPRESKYV